jgi:AraC family transcriptional regulator, regulatory protein of adaptative response / DNA-3-methyladenine glycosylase II
VPQLPVAVFTLPYVPPYDWLAISRFLAARAIPGVECVDEAGHYHRSIVLGEQFGTVKVEPEPNVHRLRVTISFPNDARVPMILDRVGRMFDVSTDPAVVGPHLSLDPRLKPLVAARAGLRLPGAWDGFELGVRAILGQQITVGAATRLAGKLVAAFGSALEIPGALTHAFPPPARIATADLRELGMPATRARAISAFAAATLADPQLFAPDQTLDDAVARYCQLPGIGRWTAQYIAMRALKHADALPVADIGLMRALADVEGTRPTPAQLLAHAERWRPWRAYATIYLWTADGAADIKLAQAIATKECQRASIS